MKSKFLLFILFVCIPENAQKELNVITGTFPVKTPLNPRIVRTIDKGSFRVEYIIF